ncbi:hypothetical protein [Leptothoe sp. PORK10 BA2]|uniref:hypothetical protein n=1 Tax=Leptothoe sp. PORK10 BA2 TaxID=3110254 RepID=UPI002B21F2A6|nr:hypothetical protein [Leptothoe sp. PORK10 BA2]MEA5464012.1 hypothetical protein [Leptothoe sp. PORK10 BA2]
MQRSKKLRETIHRGITAIAMTLAIATLNSTMALDGGIGRETVLGNPMQTVFKLSVPNVQITQNGQDSRESLPIILLSSQDRSQGHP